jgi:hypothetical protein
MFRHITDASQIVPELRHILVTTSLSKRGGLPVYNIEAKPVTPYGWHKWAAIQKGTYHANISSALERGVVLEVAKGKHIDLLDVAAFVDDNNLV